MRAAAQTSFSTRSSLLAGLGHQDLVLLDELQLDTTEDGGIAAEESRDTHILTLGEPGQLMAFRHLARRVQRRPGGSGVVAERRGRVQHTKGGADDGGTTITVALRAVDRELLHVVGCPEEQPKVAVAPVLLRTVDVVQPALLIDEDVLRATMAGQRNDADVAEDDLRAQVDDPLTDDVP